MDLRGIKRKRYEVLKEEMSVQIHKLTITSGDFNNDVQAANEDFEQMCRAMADRQGDFLTRSLLLEEHVAIKLLEGDGDVSVGESSGEKPFMPSTYAADVRKFVLDAKISLHGHNKVIFEEYQQMQKIFSKYEKLWSENMKEMKRRAESVGKQKDKLTPLLSKFGRLDIESDESDAAESDEVDA